METITEDYVSFEIAKLLKEKGFDVETEHKKWYVVKQFSTGCHWNSCTYKVGDITREYNDDCCVSIPTQQMAMKWLRKIHNIHFIFDPYLDDNYNVKYFIVVVFGNNVVEPFYKTDGDFTYEQACEEAIKYSLEHLI